MLSKSYDFRQFQAELAALDAAKPSSAPIVPAKPASAAARMARAREEFLALRERHNLSVADVVAFFPEEEGIAYLQGLLAVPAAKPRRRKAGT